MRVLLLADIHANWPALEAVVNAESFDACLVLGDVVEYGTDPAPCVDWVRQHATLTIRGNHDHGLVQQVTSTGGGVFRRLAAATRLQNLSLLNPVQLKFLSRLPVTATIELDGRMYYLVHATPRDPMDEYLGADPSTWKQRLEHVTAEICASGHTHVPHLLDLGDKQIVNPGSVGQPRDGDPRAAYAVVEDGVISLKRIEYDVDAAVASLRQAEGLTQELVDAATYVLRTGGKPPQAVAGSSEKGPGPS